jgi:hypothetical protein
MWRRWHRGVGIVLAALFLLISLSGIGLGYFLVAQGGMGPASAKGPVPSSSETHKLLDNALANIIAAAPAGSQIQVVDVETIHQPITVNVALGTADGGVIGARADLRSGRVMMNVADWSFLLLLLHTGAIAGYIGLAFSMLCGLALFFLALSGITMYIEMYRRRRRAGHRAFFWG